jgi:hypothetical protein
MPDQDFRDLLTYLAGGVGSGALVFILVQLAEKLYRKPLPPSVAFYGAMFLAFAVPLAAYGVLVATGTTPFTWMGLIAEFGIGYTVSQAIHWHAPDDTISGIGPNVAPAEKPPAAP